MRVLSLVVMFGLTAACGEPFLDYPTKVKYAPQSDGVLELTGPIITDRIPTSLDESSRNDSALFVVDYGESDLTYGQLVPTTFTYDADTLTLRSAAVEDCSTVRLLGLCVLDSVRDVNEERLGRTHSFDDAFELRDDDPSDGAFRALRPALIRAGYELGSVAGATLFTSVCSN